MKKISVVIPTYNEEENVAQIIEAVEETIKSIRGNYAYEIITIDNASTDRTREIVRNITSKNKNIKAIFNSRNFGQNNSPYYAILQTSGDCVISMSADFQDPPSLIPEMVSKWEEGFDIVSAVKETSNESRLMYAIRGMYYKILKQMSNVELIAQFTGFGLYDKKVIDFLKSLNDPITFLRGTIAEYGGNRCSIPFEQPKRRAGKTHNNFFTLYDIAMRSFTSYTKGALRIATFIGGLTGGLSILIAIVFLILKLIFWYNYPMGIAPLVIGMFFLGGMQLFFMGLIGEYVLAINERIMNRPLVVEAERINF